MLHEYPPSSETWRSKFFRTQPRTYIILSWVYTSSLLLHETISKSDDVTFLLKCCVEPSSKASFLLVCMIIIILAAIHPTALFSTSYVISISLI